MNREEGLAQIQKTKIIAIIRGVEPSRIEEVANALYQGGITVMEVTLNTSGALSMIERLRHKFAGQMFIGAGTVLDTQDLRQALQAGASFVVTPNVDDEVIVEAVRRNIPIFPGAMTPTEIVKAWKAGAAAVKIFPGSSLGLGYFKELQGPLSHIPMMAVGGICGDNILSFLQAGCYAVGIGSALINLCEIAQGNYACIAEAARRLIAKTSAS